MTMYEESQCMMPTSVVTDPSHWPAGVESLAHTLGEPFTSAQPTMAELTTMHVGGPVRDYCEASTEAELIDAVREADAQGWPLLMIGGGSNILASDAGFDGRVVRDARTEVRVDADDRCGGVQFTATAGTTWDDLVRQAVASDWGGFAPLSGIPGTVGAAPVQNIGAYGAEVAQLIGSVRAWDRLHGQAVHLPLSALALSYRNSIMKRSVTDREIGGGRLWGPTGRWVILSVTFHVRAASLSDPIAYEQLAQVLGVDLGARIDNHDLREAVIGLRASKATILDRSDHDTWSAGSFFTNPIVTADAAAALPPAAPRYPVRQMGQDGRMVTLDNQVKTSAAWLIEHAGFPRGYRRGQAALSSQHVLVLTNRGGATASDIAALRDEIVAGVEERFGVRLVPEPVHVGW